MTTEFEEKYGEKEREQKGLQNDIILLSRVPDIWRLANPLLETERGDNEGPVHAFHAAFAALKNLWYSQNDGRADPEWFQIRQTIALGLIKDTKKFGNTSVSMGAALNKFREFPQQEKIAFLNCGTGGIKYQLYSSKGCLHLIDEFKPKGGASVHSLEAGKYRPKNLVSFENTRDLFVRELGHGDLPWARESTVPMFAFVTGTMREHWERADAVEKQIMENKLRELFEPHRIRPLKSSFFMSQDDEGALELLGSQRMYANLVEAGLLDPGTRVVGSFGIGKGSCQWMLQELDGTMTLIPHRAGMSNVAKLGQFTHTLSEQYRDPVKWERFKQTFKAANRGVIALKSGAALLIENKNFAHLRAELLATPNYRKRTVRVTLESERTQNGVGKVVSYSWTGSLDRLCAEVQILLEAPRDLETIFREIDGKFIEVARDGEVFQHELLYFAPGGVIPALVLEPRGEEESNFRPTSPHPIALEPLQVNGISPPSKLKRRDITTPPPSNNDLGTNFVTWCSLL